MVADVAPIVAAAYTLTGIFYASMGTLNGQARQLAVSLSFLLGAFAIAPSTGYALAFATH